MYTNFISICAFSAKIMNGNCWWTDRPRDSSEAICLPFFEGGHKKNAKRNSKIRYTLLWCPIKNKGQHQESVRLKLV